MPYWDFMCNFAAVMILNIVYIIVGLVGVLWGADRFTDGACGLARKWKVSELIIGLTIVALGTSLPEFVVSFISCLRGSGDMSVGNIIGSNVFNIAFVLGACNMVSPMQTKDVNLVDLLTVLGSVVLLWLVCFTGRQLRRWEGVLLVAAYAAYLFYVLSH